MKTTLWSPDDVRTLRRLYPYVNNRELASMLGRPTHAVQKKASALGLKKASLAVIKAAGITARSTPETTAHGYRTVTSVPGATITRHTLL